MANTNLLKTVVEPEIIESFCCTYRLKPLSLSIKEKHRVFFDMEPDLVGFQEDTKTLYLGEITTSGYNGHKGKDFHIGATKKVYEAFSKFYLLHDEKAIVIDRLKQVGIDIEIQSIKCFFIIPEGSRFIKSLGYRSKLFEKGFMTLEKVKLTEKTQAIMMSVLESSKNEIS